MSTRTKIILGIVAAVVLAVGWYGISPLFNDIEVNDALPENVMNTDEMDAPEDEADESPATTTTPADEGEQPEQTQEPTAERFEVVGTTGHPASGYVRVLETTDGTVIRYEDFETINGPNLHVYLAKDLEANEYIDLGPIKGTRGNINYSVPANVDISEYKYVMYWCVPFSVLFNYAEIS